jgi:membrane-associated phospholipid phosphatase
MDISSFLQGADENLLKFINRDLSAPWLDGIMLLLRNQFTWIPLYAVLLFWFYKNNRKHFLLIVLMSLVTFALTDFISSGILKPLIARPRPCYAGLDIRVLVGCGGSYGMPSSHASNHFGLAMLWFSIVSATFKRKWYWLWLWAFMICYAQVYVGKHYPGDIVLGCILGCAVGLATSGIYQSLLYYSIKRENRFSLRVN